MLPLYIADFLVSYLITEHEYKTAFRTTYGQFEYRVIPFGLTSAPATFQAYMDHCLRPFMDDFVVCIARLKNASLA